MDKTDLLTARIKLFDHVRTAFPWLTKRSINLIGNKERSKNTDKIGAETAEMPEKQPSTEVLSRLPYLNEILHSGNSLPPFTIFLGLCDDGQHLTVDLQNPAPGSLLITGECESGKTRLVRSILSSVPIINSPAQASFYILAENINEYTDLAESENCRKLVSHQDIAGRRILQELFDECEKRQSMPGTIKLVLAIDNLCAYLNTLDTAWQSKFLRIIKHGPRTGIWTIATLPTISVERLEPAVLDAFRTHLLGSISDPVLATYLAGDSACPAGLLEKGAQFCASSANGWFSFWICDPGEG
jgi:hypothetical protein